MAEKAAYFNGDVICKANGKGRREDRKTKTDVVIDFRDGLQKADIDHYARLHQPGGSRTEGYPSVIKMVLTEADEDKRGGKPAYPSVTVDFNLDPHVPAMLLEVCKKTFGERVLMERGTASECVRKIGAIHGSIAGLIRHIVFLIKGGGKEFSRESLMDLSKAIKEETGVRQSNLKGTIPVNEGIRFSWDQFKGHSFSPGQETAPGKRINISREPFRCIDEQWVPATYPWSIQVVNGKCPCRIKDTGVTSYSESQMTDKKSVTIRLSDEDMFRMMNAITHYIATWENAMCIPGVIAGVKKKEERYTQQQQWDQTL